MLAITRILTGP